MERFPIRSAILGIAAGTVLLWLATTFFGCLTDQSQFVLGHIAFGGQCYRAN